MSTTGVDVFDATLHKTHVWLKELMEELEWDDPHKALAALRVTLGALRDRLTVEEVAQLGAQMPMLVRGMYYEGWDPTDKPLRERHKKAFLAHIKAHFHSDPFVDPERVAEAVFLVLDRHISRGELDDIRHTLPRELRELWPGG
jgi:uncharacterized protein (DUF2267 family)